MGQKVNPRILRAYTTFTHPSRWFAVFNHQQFAKNLRADVEVRKLIRAKFRNSGIAQVEMERALEEITINIFTSKPGVVIGRGGALIEELKRDIKRKYFGNVKMRVNINIHEVRDPSQSAELIVQSIRDQIEKRVPFRRAIKRAMERVTESQGVQGCRIQITGRLNGVEIARRETISYGRLPLHTLRANIDYSRGVAYTTYGVIGIKVWINKGEIFSAQSDERVKSEPVKPVTARLRTPRRHKSVSRKGEKLILRKKADIDKEK